MVLATLSVFTVTANVHGVDDGWRQTLREGIEARESAIHSLKIKYNVVTEHTELNVAAAKRILEESVEDGTRSRKEVDRLLKDQAPWTETSKVELLVSDGKIATSSIDSNSTPDGQTQSMRVVFDGEILTALQDNESGSRMRATPEDALPRTTINSLCQPDDFSLQELLADPRATSTLLPPAAENGDVVFQVTLTTEKDPETRGQWEIVAEINATKSFWPQHLVEAYLPNDKDDEPRYIMQEVWCSDFQKAGGMDIPRMIKKNISSMSAGGVVRRITLLVDHIAINEPVDTSEFVLNFPPGTSYLDLDGETKIVEPDGTIENLLATLARQYPVTEGTRNAGSGAWQWVALGATTLLLAVLVALYSLRFLRARRST